MGRRKLSEVEKRNSLIARLEKRIVELKKVIVEPIKEEKI